MIDPAYENDLRDHSLTSREVAARWGVGKTKVNEMRKDMGITRSTRGNKSVADLPATTPNYTERDVSSEESTDGSIAAEWIRQRPVTLSDAEDWVRSSGKNPDDYTISVRTIAYGQGMWSNRMAATPKIVRGNTPIGELSTLTHLYEEVARSATATTSPRKVSSEPGRTVVVALADWQIGKSGRRGGTKETLERLAATRATLNGVYGDRKPERIVLLDVGDGIEGFESGGDPQFTNDLSLPDQLDAYATEVFKFVEQAANHAKTTVGITPSNHSAWRRGKQNLGKPTDDFGIYVHKQVKKISDTIDLDVEWVFPDEYDESLMIDVGGVGIGAVHGNQFGPGRAIDWWQGQAFGSQAITKADVLLTGHYHSFGAGVAGINPFTGRERMWLGAPTVDPGSDWYRAIRGRDSLPGVLMFEVTTDGFNLGSLRII